VSSLGREARVVQKWSELEEHFGQWGYGIYGQYNVW
jgi:hypothetical protein